MIYTFAPRKKSTIDFSLRKMVIHLLLSPSSPIPFGPDISLGGRICLVDGDSEMGRVNSEATLIP